MTNIINVAVVGAGAFGRNHARVYHELSGQDSSIKLAAVVDSDLARAEAIAREYNAHAYAWIDQLLQSEKIDAASIAVPTIHHLAVATELMEAGIDVLIEKPLAATLEEADTLVALAQRLGRIGQVGHLERFNPAVRATLPLITHPMFFEVHRLSVFTPRSLDVDVVLDLMIHDLDVVLAFVNSPVKGESARWACPFFPAKSTSRMSGWNLIQDVWPTSPPAESRPSASASCVSFNRPVHFDRLRAPGRHRLQRGRRRKSRLYPFRESANQHGQARRHRRGTACTRN